jgi:GNAT superfamily N-acetyltransferase
MSCTGLTIQECTASQLSQVRPLWEDLYLHQRANGLLADLTHDGFDRWAGSLGPTLGRFSCVFLASTEGTPVGFLAGRMRTPTPPFEPAMVGFITEVFVSEVHRRAGMGRALIGAAERWFSARGIERMELQVLVGNASAHDSYKRLGWRDELVQMVYRISAG